ncbi:MULTISPECIES: alkene reductase [unclassified Dietzia]|uniref:alkene reductase n=1 Tax=unclassified Dietzia TaxID=2617939 RepID=UPI0015FBD767|nr:MULTISPECIES: alkene reductase [unclassified Dietzia]MBB1024175.1 alkene reductase [Dietzia sp. DQ12-76]MBB1026322.1 alkene reductase [Dietzia sp. DQ11-38-2]
MTLSTPSRLWQPLHLGAVSLDNRLVLAPMTRRRAAEDGTPTPLMSEYYAQRSGFGLVVTEGIYPSREGRAYANQPGLVDDAHERGWAAVTEAVHERGTPIFAQLMHAGRVTSPDITGIHYALAPSAIPYEDHHGHHPAIATAATARDISQLIDAHVEAAVRARGAGFDGIELHAANGYLLQQFLAPSANHRTDEYGGTPLRRARFVIDVAEAVADAIGGDRVGIRVSPGANIQGALELDDEDTRATYTALFDTLGTRHLAYVSMIHPDAGSALVRDIRGMSNAPMILNTGFSTVTDRDTAAELVSEGQVDAVAVGRPAIANPDLPRRWRADMAETAPDQTTFYEGGATGYTDYPVRS